MNMNQDLFLFFSGVAVATIVIGLWRWATRSGREVAQILHDALNEIGSELTTIDREKCEELRNALKHTHHGVVLYEHVSDRRLFFREQNYVRRGYVNLGSTAYSMVDAGSNEVHMLIDNGKSLEYQVKALTGEDAVYRYTEIVDEEVWKDAMSRYIAQLPGSPQ